LETGPQAAQRGNLFLTRDHQAMMNVCLSTGVQ
jgi:hypothetical protein